MGEALIRPASTAASYTTPTDTVAEIGPVGSFSEKLKLLEREACDKSPAQIRGLPNKITILPTHRGPPLTPQRSGKPADADCC